MSKIKRVFSLIAILLVTACGDGGHLPFPTPGKQDLVVLTHPGPLTYMVDDAAGTSGLEHDLTTAFAEELGVGVKYLIAPANELEEKIAEGAYHLATAWLSPMHQEIQASPPLFNTQDILVQHEASLPLTKLDQLAGKTLHAMAGSRQAASVRKLIETIPDLKLVEVKEGDILDLLDSLGKPPVSYVVMDARMEELANQFVPSLRSSLKLGDNAPIVWLLGESPNPELKARAEAFIKRIHKDGTLARIEERYLGHVRRLTQPDIEKFLGQIETTLPKLRKHFHSAEQISNIDWRLLAALAYQESHWDSFATSYTNVRGLMMLTEETADRLGVSNRLDVRESIMGGARYVNILKDMLPPEIQEPDRTWLALAGYNIGPGHLNAARTIARQLNADANTWYDMKRILPLLAKPKYYSRLKSGRARGGEAVILVENIRSYYDILTRNEPPQAPFSLKKENKPGKKMPGIQLKR